MKALCRNHHEIITEDMDINGIDWNSGLPFTSEDWFGGAYHLIADYQKPKEEQIIDIPAGPPII